MDSGSASEADIGYALLKKLFLGVVAHELKTKTIVNVKRAFFSAIVEAKIERTPQLNAFISHLIHDASEIRIAADDKDDEKGNAAEELARFLRRAGPGAK
jgi:hypothetical protein